MSICTSFAQPSNTIYFGADPDPCGFDQQKSDQLYKILGAGWGYNYDSLLVDLNRWSKSPFVEIDSIGASVQGRTIFRLTIADTMVATEPRTRISIHARTHPNEVQSTWVTNEIIELLYGSSELATLLRKNCIFNIIPMYNPDGVELGNGRTNANNVDLERNWDTDVMEPEAAALKKTFQSYMASDSPVRIALNMHSAYNCTRYFVYHHETGTSPAFAQDQKYFITGIKNYWPTGFENWDFFISWVNNTPTHYPESWFWLNFQESVMALTYEDMNCAEAGDYDKTAFTLLSGISDYLGLQSSAINPEITSEMYNISNDLSVRIYPNPISSNSRLNIKVDSKIFSKYDISIYNILGQKVAILQNGNITPGILQISSKLKNLSTGTYFILLQTNTGKKVIPMIILP
jgi:hypothetical protein